MKHDRTLFERIRKAFGILKVDPFSGKTLTGEFRGDRCYRVGNYRIIYSVFKERLIVHVLDIGHRREVYRRR